LGPDHAILPCAANPDHGGSQRARTRMTPRCGPHCALHWPAMPTPMTKQGTLLPSQPLHHQLRSEPALRFLPGAAFPECPADFLRPWLLQRLSGRAELLSSFDDACSHGLFCLGTPHTWVIGLLVANFAVNLQYTVIVGQHVPGHRTGECVLG